MNTLMYCYLNYNSFRLFTIEEDEEGDLETVAKIVRFTDDLCSAALTLSHSHVVFNHMVLNFYEVVSISFRDI